MKTIIIKTQKELDELPNNFDEYTHIEIRPESNVRIVVNEARENSSVVARGNSSVVARGNSSVVARENSSVEARENSSVEAWENSSVVAWGNSSVVAWENSSVVAWENSSVEARENSSVVARGNSSVVARENSSVEARENSSVVAWENSSVVARGNSSVEAWGNSSVVAWENSSVVARGNSSVEAWENSSVVAWGNSTITLFISSYVSVMSSRVVIKKLLDYSTAVFKGCPIKIDKKSETSFVREIPDSIEISFEEWLRRGYVVADGIHKRFKSHKKIKNINVFEVEDFPRKTTSYVVKRDNIFSHGETVEKAIEDLRYKIGDRNTSEFEHWKKDLDQEVSFEDAVAAYRVVTGACEFGVKEFVKSIQLPEKLTPRAIIDLTKDHYGNEKFRGFLNEL